MNAKKPFFRKESFTKEKRAKKYLMPIVVVMAVLLAFSSIAITSVSASDTAPPYTIGNDPAKDATGVPSDTNIVVHVIDDDAGVDENTVVMTVNGTTVTPSIECTPNHYILTYDPPTDFDYLQVVDVTINASDLASLSNSMTDSYSFTIKEEVYSTGGGDSEPCETIATGTILGGGIYFDMEGDFHGCGRDCTFTFHNVPSNVVIARIYVGVWMGLGCTLNVTLNGYEYPPIDLSNPPPWAKVTVTGCEVVTVGFDATSHVVPGDNTANAVTIGSCDGRQNGIGLLVVYENESMPEMQYWISEGAPVIQHGGACCGACDEFDIAFGGNVYRGSASNVIYWNMGYPNLILPYYLNGNNISNLNPDYGKGGDRYDLEKYTNIPTTYLANADNLFKYYDQTIESYWRVCTAVLGVEYERGDLTVTNISPQTLYADYTNTINATVVNEIGNVSSNGFSVTLYANDTKVDVQHVSNMSAGESEEVSFAWKPDHEGSYMLHVIADVENVVLETNETNNWKTKKVDVTAAPIVWQNQSSNVSSIPVGGAIELRAQGKSSVGLDYAALHTNETGTWTECNDYGSPMDMASYQSYSITHTSDADWNNQTLEHLNVSNGNVMLLWMSGDNNLAEGKPSYAVGDPSLGNDGNYGTRYQTPESECWADWYVDSGDITDVAKVKIIDLGVNGIGGTTTVSYTISISNDASSWTSKLTESSVSGNRTHDGLNWSCRYIKIEINSDGPCYSVYFAELEVYPSTGYKPSGLLTSTATSTENAIVSVTPTWSSTEPGGTNLLVNISVDNGATWKPATNGNEITWDYDILNNNLKYKVSLGTTDNTKTPVLHDITLNYKTKIGPKDTWMWSNFTWQNASVTTGTTVGWKICYTDVLGQTTCTDVITFDVVGPDTTPPYTEGHDPAPGATGVPRNTNISVHVKDDGDGVDKSTIVMTVNGSQVTPVITGSPADYTLTYDPPSDFDSGQVVNVTVDASDLASNEMPQDSYSFTIIGDKPDLVIKAIAAYHNATGYSPWFNLSNEVDVVIENIGGVASTQFNVSLYADGTQICKQSVSGLDVGNSTTVQFKWTPVGDDCLMPVCNFDFSYHDYNLTAVADCDNAVGELNESNNNLTKVERACYNGYMADEPLETVAHGTIRGGLIYTTGDGVYSSLSNYGDTQVTNYDITLPSGATVELARLNVYYTWSASEGTCPEMEVKITKGTETYTVPLEKAYNDIKCQCSGASWMYPWGNYVYNVTGYVDGTGTYTVTVKNNRTFKVCPAAPGLVILYKDNTKPLYEYWINEGADVLIGGRRSDGGNLALEECINNATFPGSIDTGNVMNVTLGVIAPWGDSAPDDVLYFNDEEIGRGVYHGFHDTYDETIGGISMHIGSTSAEVGANVTSIASYLINANDNMVGLGDDGDNMMPANAFLLVEYPVDYGVSATIDEGHQKVNPGENTSYTVRVKNTGTQNASYNVTISGTAVDEPTISVSPLNWNTGNLTSGSEHVTLVNISTTDDTPRQTYTLTASATCDQEPTVTDSDTSVLEVAVTIVPDFVVGNLIGKVELFKSTDDGFSSQGILTDTGDQAWGLTSDDYNGDGYLDLIVGDYDGELELFLGHGFTSAGIIADIGAEAYGLTSGDYNNDSHADFIVGDSAGELELFLNDGTGVGAGGFNSAGIISDIGLHAWGLTSCDFDGDNDIDFIAGDYDGTVKLFKNNGTGGFTSTTIGDIGSEAYGITSGDYDSDGDCDFLATADNGEVKLFRNKGDGSFTNCGTVINLGYWGFGLESNDFDDDGDVDVLGQTSTDKVNLYKNDGTGDFTFDSVVADPGIQPRGLTSGNFVSPDLIVTSVTTPIIHAGVSNIITATIENTGNEDAAEFKTALYADGDANPVDTKVVSLLNASDSTEVCFSWTPVDAGSYTLRVMADSFNKIGESIESNNNKTEAVTVEEAVLPPPTPNIIKYGYVFYNDSTPCNGAIVKVKNLNSGKEWQAETYNTSNHYELILDSNDKSVNEVLRFTATDKDPDATQKNVTEYTVTQAELDDGGIFGLNLTLQAVEEEVVYNVTTADIPVKGTVTGTHENTYDSDNVYEAIEEVESKGKPGSRYSYLEHKWTIDVIGGNKTSVTFHVEANCTDTGDGDEFKFEYSTYEDTGYEYMVTVNTTTDTNLSCELLSNLSGTVYIRVMDTNQTAGNRSLDMISIDRMFIRSVLGTPEPDTTPPAAVTDLAARDPTSSSIKLTWTAPGDDGNTGTAMSYDIRYSTSTITDANWGSATQCTGEPSPQPAGSSETFIVTGLDANTTYYFALKTSDEVPNESPLSNVASNTTTEVATDQMHVASIDMSLSNRTAGKNIFTHATALVTIVNLANGALIEGATVHGYWSNATSDTDSGITNSTGQVSLDSDEVKKAQPGTNFTFTVDNVANGLAWDGEKKSGTVIVP